MDAGDVSGVLRGNRPRWNPGNCYPEREGVFIRQYGNGLECWCLWDGHAWGGGVRMKELASEQAYSVHQGLSWREPVEGEALEGWDRG